MEPHVTGAAGETRWFGEISRENYAPSVLTVTPLGTKENRERRSNYLQSEHDLTMEPPALRQTDSSSIFALMQKPLKQQYFFSEDFPSAVGIL
jgi:hypothetical protein